MSEPPLTPSTANWTANLRFELPPLQIRSVNALLGKSPKDIAMIYDRAQRERMALHLREMSTNMQDLLATYNQRSDYEASFRLIGEVLGVDLPSRAAQLISFDIFGKTPKYAYDNGVKDVCANYKWKRFPPPAEILTAAQPHQHTLETMFKSASWQLKKINKAEELAS